MRNDVGIFRRNAEEWGMMWEYTEGMLRMMGNDVGNGQKEC